MNRPEFEKQLAILRERIAELPAEQRESLERLALETVARHEEISRSSLQGHRAVERLELAFEQFRDAVTRLVALAHAAREALASPPPIAPTEPGLN